MHIINSDIICDVINRGMVRYVQESANLNERIIKFRVVASFDTVFRHRYCRGGHWGPTLSSKYVQIEHSGETTIEKRDGLRVREKRIAILPATNRNPSVSSCTGTFIKLDSKGTEDCGCNLRKQHGVCVRGERRRRRSKASGMHNEGDSDDDNCRSRRGEKLRYTNASRVGC